MKGVFDFSNPGFVGSLGSGAPNTPPGFLFSSISVENSARKEVVLTAPSALSLSSVEKASAFTLSGISNGYVKGETLPAITSETEVTLFTYGPAVQPYTGGPERLEIATASDSKTIGAATTYNFINFHKRTHIRQEGNLVKIKFYLGTIPNDLTSFKFQVWRGVGTMNMIGEYECLPYLASNGITTITLPASIAVRINDYTAVKWVRTTGGGDFISTMSVGYTPVDYQDGAYGAADFGASVFISQGAPYSQYGDFIPILCYVDKAPEMIWAGDSNIEGYPNSFSFIRRQQQFTEGYTACEQFRTLANMTVQNHGWSGQTSTQIKDRVIPALINQKPRYLVTEFTINGSLTQDYLDIAAACAAAPVPIQMICLSFQPCAGWYGDTWSVQWEAAVPQLEALGVLCLDIRPIVGREGTLVSNVFTPIPGYGEWHLQPGLATDGNHRNSAGHALVMQAIVNLIRSATPVSISGSAVSLTMNKEAVYSDVITLDYTPTVTPVELSDNITPAAAFTAAAVTNNIAPGEEVISFSESVIGASIVRSAKHIPAAYEGYAYAQIAASGESALALSDINSQARQAAAPGSGQYSAAWYSNAGDFYFLSRFIPNGYFGFGGGFGGKYAQIRKVINAGVNGVDFELWLSDDATDLVTNPWTFSGIKLSIWLGDAGHGGLIPDNDTYLGIGVDQYPMTDKPPALAKAFGIVT